MPKRLVKACTVPYTESRNSQRRQKRGRSAMYHIAVLTKSETQETFYREQLSRFCAEHGLFPRVDCYRGQEVFFEVAREKCADQRCNFPSGRGWAECSGAPAGAFPGNAHYMVQRAGFFPACVPAARRLLSAGADNGRSIPAGALCMGRGKTTVCFPSASSRAFSAISPTRQSKRSSTVSRPTCRRRFLRLRADARRGRGERPLPPPRTARSF
mgnify:CR=1 FL=1